MSDMVVSRRAPFAYRWTIRGVDPRLVRRLKIEALESDESLAQLVNLALEQWLSRYTGPNVDES